MICESLEKIKSFITTLVTSHGLLLDNSNEMSCGKRFIVNTTCPFVDITTKAAVKSELDEVRFVRPILNSV